MAKAGIGYISLVDDQRLSAHNAIRHIAGIDMTDEFKVFAVAELLRQHNHYITVHPLPFNLFNFEYNYLPDQSLSISTVADDYAELFVNEQMVISNRTVFYARALRGGKAARIFRVIPGKDACFYCLSLYRNDKKEFIDIPEDADYPTLKNECNNPIRPASAADMKLAASFVSQMVIDHLQNGTSESNHWIWTSEVIPATPLVKANSMYDHFISPHPGCPYCNNSQRKTLSIPAHVFDSMQSLVSQNPLIETGGVAGYTDEDGNVIITHASGPGPKAVQLATRFEKDVQFCQQFLDDLFISSSRKYVYVGEWHSHPSKDNRPSGLDIKSLSEISVEKNYLTTCPAMIILSNTGKPSCTFHPAGKSYYYTELNINND
ncbi:Mov34/MPN/PAD-1 family protein [Niabella defluvii]|nr:Mov34/MPN/PAD-1 family protein [Niabella sp. I65]